MTLETCRGTQFYVIYIKKIVYQVGINKGIIPLLVTHQNICSTSQRPITAMHVEDNNVKTRLGTM